MQQYVHKGIKSFNYRVSVKVLFDAVTDLPICFNFVNYLSADKSEVLQEL